MLQGALISPSPIGKTDFVSVKDCLDLPAFNAMYEADPTTSSSKYCKDPTLGLAFIKNIIHDFIRIGGKNIDINFFMDTFGYTPLPVDTRDIYNRYVGDPDYNIYFEAPITAGAADTDFTVKVLKANHSANGKNSYPEKYYSVLDKENNTWYSIEAKDTSVDFGHLLTLHPLDKTKVGSVVANKKYLIFPSRFVGDFSSPHDINDALTMGFAQKVGCFRLRNDWCVKLGLLRGYKNKLRFVIMWDNAGNKITAWDTFEAQKKRENLQLALNVLAFIGTPITAPGLINGAGATNVDDQNTGFYGYFPSLKYGGGQVVDFDAAVGLDLDADVEPFILSQDSMKQTMSFLCRHGKSFKASLINRTNKMVRKEGLGLQTYNAFTRMGTKLTKLEYDGYEYLGFNLGFNEWGSLNDTRLLGSQFFDNLGMLTPLDGIVNGETGAEMGAVEFYQHGDKETGEYYETQNDKRQITREENIEGFCTQSIMMATHAPVKHAIFNPATC